MHFAYTDLVSAQCSAAEVLATCKLLLGKLWALWFPDGKDPDATSIVPRQMAQFLHYALDQLKSKYENLEETRADAAASYALILGNHKRRRADADGLL